MDRAKFFAAIRSLFAGAKLSQAQVDRIEAVIDGLHEESILVPSQAAYILATAHHESDQFRTMEEYASGAAYEGRKTLGNTKKGDGKRFKGRGFVQITGRRNYTDWSKRLGVDLLKKPKLASELEYAVPILIRGMMLGTFTGKKLSDYVTLGKADFKNARRVVNGIDRANHIAVLAMDYEKALNAAWFAARTPASKPAPVPAPSKPARQPSGPAKPAGEKTRASGSILGAFALIVVAVVLFIIFGS